MVKSLVIKEVRREIRGLMMDLNSFIKFGRALFSMKVGRFVGKLCVVSLPVIFA